MPDEIPTVTGVFKAVEDHWAKARNVLALVGIIGGGLLAIGGIASAQTDAGLKTTRDQLELVITDRKVFKEETAAKFAQSERRMDRMDERMEVQNKKLDLLLDAARVPLYKRPDEVDTEVKSAVKPKEKTK